MYDIILHWFDPGELWFEHSSFDPWDDYVIPTTVGDPSGDASLWHQQQDSFTCAVASQKMILEAFGIEISESELVYEAVTHGWLTIDGTNPLDMSQLLELHGIETHMGYGGGVQGLINELRHGHKVIVGLDSGEIWNQDWFGEDFFNPWGDDHVVMVTGMDMSDPGNPMVFLNDPGHPAGAGMPVPLDQFVDAWNDSGQMYVATNDAPPDLENHSLFGANFSYGNGVGQYMDDPFWMEFQQRFMRIPELTASSIDATTRQTIEFLDDDSRTALLLTL